MSDPIPPKFDFHPHPSTSPLQVSSRTYLQNHPDSPFDYIATGAIVFDSQARILLVQRCAHDSWPNRWEIPGGACDDEDETILHGAARELWEESGLEASVIGPMIGDVQRFTTSSGKKIGKLMFMVEVANGTAPKVKLDPNEHQNFVWAREEEVKMKQVGNSKLEFTTTDAYNAILQAFRLQMSGKT